MGSIIMEFVTKHWLSVGTAVFLLAMVLYGHYRGFLRIAVSMVALVVTLVIVRMGTPYMTNFLMQNTGIHAAVERGLLSIAGVTEVPEDKVQMPAGRRLLIEELNLPEQMKEALIQNNNHEVYRLLGVDAFMDYIGTYLTNMVLNVVCSIVLFLVVYIGIRMLMHWLDLLAKLPILSGMNQIAGAILGGVQGLLVIWVLCLVVAVCSATEWGKVVVSQIESSPWLLFLYKNNIFNWLVAGILNSFQ